MIARMIAVVLVANVVAAATADPPKTRAIVVAPLHVVGGRDTDKQLGELSGELLAIALADHKTTVVVDRQKLKDVLQEQKLALSGLVEPATAVRVGKLLAADLVVAGSIIEIDGKLRYAVNVIAVDSQRVVGSAQADGAREEVDRIGIELATRIAAVAGVPLPKTKPEELDDSPVGRLHLMRGVSFYHANNPDQAIVCCLQAVRLDPRLLEARLWIARSYLRLSDIDQARAELTLLARNPAATPLTDQIKKLLAQCAAGR